MSGQVFAGCVPCMKRGPGGWLLEAEAFTDSEGRYMARGTCGGCQRPVEQYIKVQDYAMLAARS